MTDETNPRAEFDKALEAMRRAKEGYGDLADTTMAALVACAEALSLLVDAHLATPAPESDPEPEPDPRESLPDDTPVGHGWVMGWGGEALFKPDGNGRLTSWLEGLRQWEARGIWRESGRPGVRPATVGDLRRVGLPVTEWPDITSPEPEAEQAERAEAITERDNAITALRAIRNKLANLAAGHVEGSDDARGAYWESLYIVKTEARRRSLDLGEEVS